MWIKDGIQLKREKEGGRQKDFRKFKWSKKLNCAYKRHSPVGFLMSM